MCSGDAAAPPPPPPADVIAFGELPNTEEDPFEPSALVAGETPFPPAPTVTV
jgi:hypothetical protein